MTWIKNKDVPPDQDGHYLACLTYLDPMGRQKHKIKVCRYDSAEDAWYMGAKAIQATYWRTLPEPPEEIYA